MTPEEKQLWYQVLKPLPVTFKRQKVFGNYIVDFYCASAKIIIEVDGAQHYEPENQAADRIRDAFLERCGYTVLRYSNQDIHRNLDGVRTDILLHLRLDTE